MSDYLSRMDVRDKPGHVAQYVKQRTCYLKQLTFDEILDNLIYREALVRFLHKDEHGNEHQGDLKFLHYYMLCDNLRQHTYLMRNNSVYESLHQFLSECIGGYYYKTLDIIEECLEINDTIGIIYELEVIKDKIINLMKESTGCVRFCIIAGSENKRINEIFESIYWDIHK